MPTDIIETLAQFGVAGLMGVLWVWERTMSRRREAQLDAAHDRLVRQRHDTRLLLDIVRRNTAAIEQFDRTQQRLHRLLETIHEQMRDTKAA